jgi:phospholipid/cholesterol/gamma-HCH transport system ATP-binding protein
MTDTKSQGIIVSFQHVRVEFGEKVALEDVNLDIYENETIALIGASGAGKSVLVRSLIGLEKPVSGRVMYRETDVVGKSEEEFIEIRKKIAYAFQFGALFDSLSVFDNLAYPLREHAGLPEPEIRTKVLDTLNSLGLKGTEKLFPANLSGGMQKRVGVARAIILGPEIILYDEPTSGLDPFNTKNINDLIIRLSGLGNTSIVITHDMPSAFNVADRIAMLFNGKIGFVGATEEAKHSENRIVRAFVTGETPEN